ncbi:MAG: AIR synthase family protein [Butyribacter sp.]|nr:AIR synthase family protein [bacterium]MDY3854086.1 AIR synthase family protein [Butyribacter sp.]
MEIGKVPENVLKRAVFKQIRKRRPEVILHPAVGEDCSAIAAKDDEMLVFSVDPITVATKQDGMFAVHITANDLASSGAEPVGIMTSILLPPGTREIRLRELMQEMERACALLQMEIIGGHTEISDAVNRPVVTVTGIGKVKKGELITTGGLKPGDELVMTKWAGIEGTAIIASQKREKLLETLPEELVDEAASFREYLSVMPEAAVAKRVGVSAMHDVTEGGIFGALWEIGAAADTGITADLMKIPIRQETIEVCEVFDINPYQMMSSGSLLIGCRQGNLLVEELNQAGIPAVVIGRATETNDRIVRNGEDIRFLGPAGSDEIYKI